jgi:hypothetical protein
VSLSVQVAIRKIPQIGWLKHLFLTVLKAGKSEVKTLTDSMSAGERRRTVLPGSQKAIFSLCFHMMERARELIVFFFFNKVTNTIDKGSTLMT